MSKPSDVPSVPEFQEPLPDIINQQPAFFTERANVTVLQWNLILQAFNASVSAINQISEWIDQQVSLINTAEASWATAAVVGGEIDLSEYHGVYVVELTANVTRIVLPTLSSESEARGILILFKQDEVGGRTVTGWGSAFFEGGVAPVIGSGAGAITSVPVLVLGDGSVYVVG
jgi:hypothetical protein